MQKKLFVKSMVSTFMALLFQSSLQNLETLKECDAVGQAKMMSAGNAVNLGIGQVTVGQSLEDEMVVVDALVHDHDHLDVNVVDAEMIGGMDAEMIGRMDALKNKEKVCVLFANNMVI